MGLRPYDYYCMTPYEFQCMVSGWRKKKAKEAAIARKQIQLIYGMIGGKDDFAQIWPIAEIDEADGKRAGTTRKQMREIMRKMQEKFDNDYKAQLN